MLSDRLWRNLDWVLILTVLAVEAFGLVMIGSATQVFGSLEYGYFYVQRQMIWILLGWGLIAFILTVDYNYLTRFATPLYIFMVLALLAIFIPGVGIEKLGAKRWIGIRDVFELQPSEFAKITLIITLSYHLSRIEKFDRFTDLIPVFLHAGVPMLLIMRQPDLGTSLVFLAIVFAMLFMAGAPLKWLLSVYGGGLAAVIGWIWAHTKYGIWLPLKEYQLNRLLVFINPELDRLGSGYHIIQSKIAVGSGGLFGKGIGLGTQNTLEFLPEQHTDFIFAVIGEELGFIGALLVLCGLLFLLYRAVRIVAQAKDPFGLYLATGVVAMLFFHIFTNVGMTISLMPVTGIPLPFISYGGSSLLTNSVGVGILLNVYMRRKKILF